MFLESFQHCEKQPEIAMKSALKVVGFNFNKLETKDDLKILQFTDIPTRSHRNFLICSGPFYEIIIYNELKLFDIKSSILSDIENTVQIESLIKNVLCSEENCYFLDENGRIQRYNVKLKEFSKISIELKNQNEFISQISSTLNSLYAISNTNRLYQILPQMILIHEFKSHQKIKKIQSGLEHTLILTNNGDVFAFGCCLRGQTGLGKMSLHDDITLIEALSGIKIIDIACSAFSSFAVSSFGDLYSFGWNTNGQLGIKKVADRCKQVYILPEIVELEQECDSTNLSVICGHKHTILRAGNKVFVTGLNNYGQLGIGSAINEIDTFKEISIDKINDKTILCCGYWTTYLINYVED